jgi:hypothetical protein
MEFRRACGSDTPSTEPHVTNERVSYPNSIVHFRRFREVLEPGSQRPAASRRCARLPGSAYRGATGGSEKRQMKLKLDLHEIYNRGQDIDRALRDIIDEAVRKKAPLVEIIPGKGSGQLKKHVLRFLEQKEIKALYHRVEKDSKNFGRLFIHFRWK